MRILFVSGTTVGGSGRSQRELAARLVGFGHLVEFVVDDASPARATRWAYEQLSDLSARVGNRRGSGVVRRLERLPGRKASAEQLGGLKHLMTAIPENATEQVIESFRPDVVIGNSILRLAWRKVRAMCVGRQIATILYIREEVALNHFANGVNPADAIVANAKSLVAGVERMGIACAFVPSVIELHETLVTSTRQAALVVNPIPSHGIELIWDVAARLPEIAFVIQESWPLGPDQLSSVQRHVEGLPNVQFRRAQPPGPRLYQDARVLLVPHRIDNRPRVIAEVQANGIPVIASNMPGLIEAVGPGGSHVGPDDIDQWCVEIERLWSDEARYDAVSTLALVHSYRPEIDAASVARQFEQIAQQVVDAQR